MGTALSSWAVSGTGAVVRMGAVADEVAATGVGSPCLADTVWVAVGPRVVEGWPSASLSRLLWLPVVEPP